MAAEHHRMFDATSPCGSDLAGFVARLREAADEDSATFREPWQAQAFAMTSALHERGLFAWSEWAQALAAALREAEAAGSPDTNETYYRCWLVALERIASSKSLADEASQLRYRHAWEHAAARTPHGMPIELEPADFEPTAEKASLSADPTVQSHTRLRAGCGRSPVRPR